MSITPASYILNQNIKLKGEPLNLNRIFRPEDFKKMECCIPILRSRLDYSIDYYTKLKERTASQVKVDKCLLQEWTKIVFQLQALKAEILHL